MALILAAIATREALIGNVLLLVQIAPLWGVPIYIGIFAATLSSALASLVGAPRVFQSLCRDNIFPFLAWFGKGHGVDDEPRRAYALTFVLSMAVILIGELDVIASLISQLFLATYAVVNYACFAASVSDAPGFRPSFRYYNPWVSLLGAAMCLFFMILIDWRSASVAVVLGAVIIKYVQIKQPDVNWGSASQARAYVDTLRKSLQLRDVKKHVKTYRPAFLVSTGDPEGREPLLRFVTQFQKGGAGVVIAGNVVVGDDVFHTLPAYHVANSNEEWLLKKGYRVFLDTVVAENVRAGVQALMCTSGLGALKPNTLVVGYPREGWNEWEDERKVAYTGMIADALDLRFGVMLCRDIPNLNFDTPYESTIDIYWLVDDGGLKLLLPFLLLSNSIWSQCKLRVMFRARKDHQLTADQAKMTRLLSKFRIRAEVVPLENLEQPPSALTRKYFEETTGLTVEKDPTLGRYMRIGEVARGLSANSALLFMTLPVPKAKGSGVDYMHWIDAMSSNLPPLVLVRGSQESVLTFEA